MKTSDIVWAFAVWVLVITTSCKVRATNLPPPIQEGKCLTETYIGNTAQHQTCNYQGYTWDCSLFSDDTRTFICKRGPESVERPALPVVPLP